MQSLASKSQNNQTNNAFYGNINPHIGYQKISRMMLKFKYFKRWQVKTKYRLTYKKARNSNDNSVNKVPQNNHHVWELHMRRDSERKVTPIYTLIKGPVLKNTL